MFLLKNRTFPSNGVGEVGWTRDHVYVFSPLVLYIPLILVRRKDYVEWFKHEARCAAVAFFCSFYDSAPPRIFFFSLFISNFMSLCLFFLPFRRLPFQKKVIFSSVPLSALPLFISLFSDKFVYVLFL